MNEQSANNAQIFCRYCNRALEEYSPYAKEKGIPMCNFCEVKHKEFEAIMEIRRKRAAE